MKNVIKVAVTGSVLAFAVLAGGKASAAELPKDANTTCPVMTKEDVDPDIFVDYKGKRVYMCCTKCKKRFAQDPEKYMARLNHSEDSKTTATGKTAPSTKQ